MTLRVAVVGGGPGGLFFASQYKAADPSAEVTVFERNQSNDIFGFGVVFSDSTLNQINAADPVLREALSEHGTHWDRIEVWLKGERRSFAGNGMAAIHRGVLLPILQESARAKGVTLRFGVDVTPDLLTTLADDFDVVVGADGANSRVRSSIEDHISHTVDTASAKFIWFGTRFMFDGLTFVHRRAPEGNFAVHAYPISADLSTFIVETDDQTWRDSGLDAFDVTQAPGPSDDRSKAFLTDLFAADINGREVVANHSRWASFKTRRSERWSHRNIVLLGDAVHTAHFSVGSGTKMAMEDGIVLAHELANSGGDVAAAFAAYEAERKPQVARIQDSARGGLSWWERFGRYHTAFEPTQFAFHFFSRSIDIDRIEPRDPGLVASVREDWIAGHGAPALQTPFSIGSSTMPGRLLAWVGDGLRIDQHGERIGARTAVLDASKPVHDIPSLLTDAEVAVIKGGTPLDRLLLSEDVRLTHTTPTVVVAEPGDRMDPETVVLAGRADAVALHG